jgi:soluble lytic murein transglycosylase
VRMLVEYPNQMATLRDGLAVSAAELSEKQRFLRAKRFYDVWAYPEAREGLDPFRNHPRFGSTSRWLLALIGLRKMRDRPEEAESIFRGFRDSTDRGEEALYYEARAQMKQERYAVTLRSMNEYMRRYPEGKHAASVRYYRGWLPYDNRENEKALKGFQAYIDRYGLRSRKSSYIYGFRAWALMRLSRWEEAIEAWRAMAGFGNPLVAGKALYWTAFAQAELGREEGAKKTLDKLRTKYPITYYGMLGEQLRATIEGRDARASQVWWPSGGGLTEDKPAFDLLSVPVRGLSKSAAANWQRTKTLVRLGEPHRARTVFRGIEKEVMRSAPPADRDRWIHALGWFTEDFNTMWKRATGGSISAMPALPKRGGLRLAMAYPRAYEETVDDVAREFVLPPELIWSIMRQESRYKPSAVSYTNAVGALQMIPKTARRVAADLGTVYELRTFFRPEVGFRFSGFYMRKLLDVFDGLFVPMAASYNSGPKVVASWFKRNPEASFPWLIEEFEYNEGRAYCRKVSEHMLRYLYLYEPDAERRGRILDAMFPPPTWRAKDVTLPDEIDY